MARATLGEIFDFGDPSLWGLMVGACVVGLILRSPKIRRSATLIEANEIGLEVSEIEGQFAPGLLDYGKVDDVQYAFMAKLNGKASIFYSPERFTEMGVEPFILASAAIGALSQRLVRTLCTNCRKVTAPDAFVVERDVGERDALPGEVPVDALEQIARLLHPEKFETGEKENS